MKNLSLLAAAAVAAAAIAPAAASAQECPSGPAFAEISTSNRDVRASSRSLRRGDFEVAVHFATEALESSAPASHKAAASVNLCAAYAQLGALDLAAPACDTGVEQNPESWEALINRGGALWLAGNAEAARADFEAAAQIAGPEDAVEQNLRLAECAR